MTDVDRITEIRHLNEDGLYGPGRIRADISLLLAEIERWKAAAVAAYDGNELVQQANQERDYAVDAIREFLAAHEVAAPDYWPDLDKLREIAGEGS